jgi:hypothetical protein
MQRIIETFGRFYEPFETVNAETSEQPPLTFPVGSSTGPRTLLDFIGAVASVNNGQFFLVYNETMILLLSPFSSTTLGGFRDCHWCGRRLWMDERWTLEAEMRNGERWITPVVTTDPTNDSIYFDEIWNGSLQEIVIMKTCYYREGLLCM